MASGLKEDSSVGLSEGIRAFNQEAYFEAHDIWEETWRGVRGPDRLFFQGLIQLAIGFYHLTTENLAGAEHLLTRGGEKLEAYMPSHRSVDVARLVIGAAEALVCVRAARRGGGLGEEAWELPQIQQIPEN